MKKTQKNFLSKNKNKEKSNTYKKFQPNVSTHLSPQYSPNSSDNNRIQNKQKTNNKDNFVDDLTKWHTVQFLTIDVHHDGQRLDNFLLGQLKGVPKSHLYKLIRDGQIRLNKKRIKPMERLMVGDVVRVPPIRLADQKTVMVGDELQQALLDRVVYEDDGLMVLNKPFGLAVHGGSGQSVGVIEAMRVATGKPYLELVHRIDKETSGLLMIAKKRSTLKELQERLRQKTLQKTYLCLVTGHIKQKELIVDKPLLKYTLASGERRVKVSDDTNAKPSVTKVVVLTTFYLHNQKVSLVQCEPKTGRTHQIRVHMASLGHPLLGDDKYHLDDQSGVRRLCLHAWQLTIAGYPPLVAPMPEDIQALLGDVSLPILTNSG